MRRFFAVITAFVFGLYTMPINAEETFSNDASVPPSSTLSPNTFSLSDLGPIQSSGSVSDPRFGNLSWSPGTPASQLFTLGMFKDSFGFQNLSLNQISSLSNQPVQNAPLSDFGLIQNMSLAQLASTIPDLGQLPVSAVPPVAAIASLQGVSGLNAQSVASVASLLPGPIGQLGSQLTKFSVSDIPGLSKVPLSNLPGWANAQIASIPGLDKIPLINPLTLQDYFVPFDIGFGMSPCNMGADCHERDIDNTASGNWDNLSIPCTGATQSCAHIEVRRWNNDTNHIRWVSKEQQVSGGNGFLCKKEPTGRFPFGKNPKVAVEKIKEKEGEVDFALYFSVDGPFGAESAHCFGPFPMPFWGTRKEGELILFGPDKVSATSPFSALLDPSVGPGGGSECSASGSPAAAGGGTYKGVNMGALKAAISNVESRGSGGYAAVGVWLVDGDGNVGRALGKYQFMSYGPAKDIILSKPGGDGFLGVVNNSNNTAEYKAYISGALERMFTPQEQENLMTSSLKHLVDVGVARGLQGDALIQRIAEMHDGGEGSRDGIDSQYSEAVVKDYKNGGGSVASAGCTGELATSTPVDCGGKKLPYIRPVQGPITSPYGWRWGGRDFHPGIDLGDPIGTPIQASNCGVVDEAGWRGGYGNYTCINHGGDVETCYAHQSAINVKVGEQVKQGQIIGLVGSTGLSTGPHLHFEYRIKNITHDPKLFVPI